MSVVRIEKPATGWEIIPNAFADDQRLSEDAVAVGLWLATKPGGWIVRPTVIQETFSRRPGKRRGREWWQRVVRELTLAGYMRLIRIHDEAGKFGSVWYFCVSGLPDHLRNSGSAGAGSASRGLTEDGLSPLYKQDPVKPELNKTTTVMVDGVVVSIEDIVEAGVWAQLQIEPIKSDFGFRKTIRERAESAAGPNAGDLSSYRRWKAEQIRIATDRDAKAQEQAETAARDQERAKREGLVAGYLASLNQDAHEALVADFGRHVEAIGNNDLRSQFVRHGLKSKRVAPSFVRYVASLLDRENGVAA